jgi:hypothetical protein
MQGTTSYGPMQAAQMKCKPAHRPYEHRGDDCDKTKRLFAVYTKDSAVLDAKFWS